MRTSPVKALVREILASLPLPYTEHVIEDVFYRVEVTPALLAEYESLCVALGKTVVNNWIGYWVANALGKTGDHQVPSRRSKLVASYSLLDTDAKTVLKKPKEAEALQLMSDYYRANKSDLPNDIRRFRDAIVDLIMEGLPADQAFAAVRTNTL